MRKVFEFFLISSLALSCKIFTPKTHDDAKKNSPASLLEKEKTAASAIEIGQQSEFYQKFYGIPFEQRFSSLPTSASVPDDKLPYSGFGYPADKEGTNIKWKDYDGTILPSVLQKYDTAFNGQSPKAVNWELEEHSATSQNSKPSWAGHCNGWAAAAQRHKEPRTAVTRNGVVFETHDIKALLAEINMSATTYFLGGNRCLAQYMGLPLRPHERSDVTAMGVCEDINPGTFHLILTNWLGRMKQSVIFDVSYDQSIWNFPVYKYDIVWESIPQSKAAQLITNQDLGAYPFNPEAKKWITVKAQVFVSYHLQQEPLRAKGPTREEKIFEYQYVLELDENDNILGGEWHYDFQKNHPDFVWIAFQPFQSDGGPLFGNPHVDINEVLSIWAESVGEDPKNPPLGLIAPNAEISWGDFDEFSVIVDGGNQGSVFLGKDIIFELQMKKLFDRNMSMTLSNNGTVIKNLETIPSEGLHIKINEPQIKDGLNNLTITFEEQEHGLLQKNLGFFAAPRI